MRLISSLTNQNVFILKTEGQKPSVFFSLIQRIKRANDYNVRNNRIDFLLLFFYKNWQHQEYLILQSRESVACRQIH